MGREQMRGIGYPICLTLAKCLKTLGGGDPNGVPTSQRFQRLTLSNHAVSGRSRAETTDRDCLTFSSRRFVPRSFPPDPLYSETSNG